MIGNRSDFPLPFYFTDQFFIVIFLCAFPRIQALFPATSGQATTSASGRLAAAGTSELEIQDSPIVIFPSIMIMSFSTLKLFMLEVEISDMIY